MEKLGCANKVQHILVKKHKIVIHASDEQSAASTVAAISVRAKVVRHEFAGINRMDQDL